MTLSVPVLRRARASAAAVLLFSGAAFAPGAAAQVGPPARTLTLEEALASARAQNPDLLAQQNDLVAARADVRAADGSFLPSLSASGTLGYTAPGVQRFGSEVFGERPAYYSSSYGVSLGYDLSGAKLMQPRIARANQTATEQRVAGYEANLVGQVAQQYLTVLQSQEQTQQAERELERTRVLERIARARLEAGAVTPLDLRRAETDRGQAEVTVEQRRNTERTEMLRLGRLTGQPLAPDTRLTSTFALFEPTWRADSLVQVAMANNPNLLAFRAQSRAARTNVRAARSQYLPSLSLSVGLGGNVYSAGDIDPLVEQQLASLQGQYQGCLAQNELLEAIGQPPINCSSVDPSQANVRAQVRRQVRESNPSWPFGFETQPLSAQMVVSLPVFNGLAREQQIEQARVSAQDAELQVRAQELQLATDISAAVLTLESAYRTARLQEQVVGTAAEELRLAQERYRFGAADAQEVINAQTNLSEAERGRIDAVYNFHKSLAALEALIGQPLR